MKRVTRSLETKPEAKSFLDGLIDVLIQSYESYAMK
jgi:hypothetical protein